MKITIKLTTCSQYVEGSNWGVNKEINRQLGSLEDIKNIKKHMGNISGFNPIKDIGTKKLITRIVDRKLINFSVDSVSAEVPAQKSWFK